MWCSGIQFKLYQDILAGKVKLPNLPDNTMKLRHTLANPNFKVKDLIPPLHANPELVSVILQAANSTVFYGTRPVSELSSAVVKLGASSVTSLVLAHAVETTFIKQGLSSRHVIRSLWKENMRVAALAAAVARRVSDNGGQVDSDKALLAGSMYHVGTLMLLSYFQNRNLAMPTEEQLDEIPGALSSNVGVVLAKHWRLDDQVVTCIRNRDYFEELTPGAFNLQDAFQLAALIYRIHDKNDESLPSLDRTIPVKKAALHGLLGESLDHFVLMVSEQANLLLQTLAGGVVRPQSAAERYEVSSFRSRRACA